MTTQCPRCGAPRLQDHPFCQQCGLDYRTVDAAATPPQPQAYQPPPQPQAYQPQPQPPVYDPSQPQPQAYQPPAPGACPRCQAPLYAGYPRCTNCGLEIPTAWGNPQPLAQAPASKSSRAPLFAVVIVGLLVVAGIVFVATQPKGGSGSSPTPRGAAATDPATAPGATEAAVPTDVAVGTSATEIDDAEAIVALLDANVAATNAEDIDAYMACVDPDSPVYSTTRTQLQTVFDTYDIHVVGSDYRILDVSAAVAHVRAVITTTKVSGPAFRDNRLTAVFELHKVAGEWKIYGQTVSGIEYL